MKEIAVTRPNVLILNEHAHWYAERLAKIQPEFEYRAALNADEAMAMAAGAEVLIGLAPYLSAQLVAAMDQLDWVQALTTGVDSLLQMPELPKGVAVTNCHGIHGPQMSELALLLMLSCARRFPDMLKNQSNAQWKSWEQPLLSGKTICILGLGSIAETLARVCGALAMQVIGVSDGRSQAPGIERVFPRIALTEAAAMADFLVVLIPYAPATHHIVSAEVLAAMKPGAFLINIARGGCVDEAALLDALRSRRIAGAGLDVFSREPLPPDSPFWNEPSVIVTPHVGGYADVYREQALPIITANLASYITGGKAALSGRLDPGKES